ncbi:MAG TPA: YicC/YloC family endoribonuclease [Syntrophomonadaceae bacterium]|nr:YicC/YloC family endoribonuclease [Syntrophomonadaceae bacterium]
MVRSMTGFGRAQVNRSGYMVNCEVKAVNHRYLDIGLRISRRYNMLEERIKEEIKRRLSRGRVELSFNIEKTEDSRRNIKLDKGLAMAYYNNLKELAENLNISQEISLIDLFRLPEVFNLDDEEENLELLWELVRDALDQAITGLLEMRRKEGANLASDIEQRSGQILVMVEILEQRSPQVVKEYDEKLRNRIADLVAAGTLDEQRLIQEVVLFADKTNVTEEIVRLKSHLQHLDEMLETGDAIGRKCDFLIQELFREINTVASKANDLDMNRIVIEVKAELEKIREQIQNIE